MTTEPSRTGPRSRPAPRLRVKIVVLAMSVVFALLGCEVALRIFVPEGLEFTAHHKLFCEHDPVLGWRKLANFEGTHVTSEYAVTERLNGRGLRGPDYSYEKPEGRYRVLVLGDSFVEGYTVAFEKTFTERLAARLRDRDGVDIEVINAGTGGYASDQALLFFEHEGRRYHPDLTVLMFFDNDVWYNNQAQYWRGQKPLFRISADGLELTNTPVPAPAVEPAAPAESDPLFRSIKKWIAAHSRVYVLVRDRIKSSGALARWAVSLGIAEPPAEHELPATVGANVVPSEWRVYERDPGPVIEQAWQVTEAIIDRLRRKTEEASSRLLVCSIPFDADIYRHRLDAIHDQYDLEPGAWEVEQVSARLGAICDRVGVDYLDPTQAFRDEAEQLAAEDQVLYFPLDGHWNALGHDFMARLVAEHIGPVGTLSAGAASGGGADHGTDGE